MAADSGSNVVTIPWYATGFRGDKLEAALADIAPLAGRYGATHYEVLRSQTDRYRFQQTATFDEHLDFERYWYGPEFIRFRAVCSGWYQVPVVYEWHDRAAYGVLDTNGAPWPRAEATVD